jgi:hypothetical protein
MKLSFATMFVHPDDFFCAPDEEVIALFETDGTPASGDVTSRLMLWDAGTETNEEPGVGLNQGPRQAGPDAGNDNGGTVTPVNDACMHPDVAEVILVTVRPRR